MQFFHNAHLSIFRHFNLKKKQQILNQLLKSGVLLSQTSQAQRNLFFVQVVFFLQTRLQICMKTQFERSRKKQQQQQTNKNK